MGVRINGIMNGIVNSAGEYQAINRKSDEYSDKLNGMGLSKEVQLLIDSYVNEQNALGFSDCKEMLLEKCLPTGTKEMITK